MFSLNVSSMDYVCIVPTKAVLGMALMKHWR
jgi:hypothetical protein